MAPITSTLALGAGCYWGTEKFIVKDFPQQQQQKYAGCIANAKVGFMSPDPNSPIKNPTYRQVCSGSTGHVEVLHIELITPTTTVSSDNVDDVDHVDAEVLFKDLIQFFFTFHDPTTLNRQGNDVGTQYSSVIFCTTAKQKEIAQQVKNELQAAIDQGIITTQYENKTVQTAIVDYTEFYEAHEEHQEYLMKNPLGYCNHRYRFQKWPTVVVSVKEDHEL
jgi:peptide-methionine (S)-S-oxide reductase